MTGHPVLFGYYSSTYTRVARLALEEKRVRYEYVPVANESGYEKLPGFADLHPFAKVPVLRHGQHDIYETAAIIRYIDEAFDGPSLQPASPFARARMQQMISIFDNYAFRPWVQIIVTQRLFLPPNQAGPDEKSIADAMPAAHHAADAIDILLADRLAEALDLADIYILPAIHYLDQTPEGSEIMGYRNRLNAWWNSLKQRPFVTKLLPPTL